MVCWMAGIRASASLSQASGSVTRRADGTLELGAYEKPAERVNADIYRHNYYYNGHKTTDGVYKAWVKPYEGAYQVTRLGELP